MVMECTQKLKKKRGNIANLKPYKPGAEWKGNPGGRPKGKSLTSQLLAELQKNIPDSPEFQKVVKSLGLKKNPNFLELVARALVVNMAKGNAAAIREVCERTDGKVALPLLHSGPDGGNIPFEINDARNILAEKLHRLAGRKP